MTTRDDELARHYRQYTAANLSLAWDCVLGDGEDTGLYHATRAGATVAMVQLIGLAVLPGRALHLPGDLRQELVSAAQREHAAAAMCCWVHITPAGGTVYAVDALKLPTGGYHQAVPLTMARQVVMPVTPHYAETELWHCWTCGQRHPLSRMCHGE